eukprot:CAMPEP_0202962994 /NCGR_PEP_ID=MMETSP1396-20130829/7004_1 /ASSEMBLY_ACC=CAM_ASM_000872 /TAXON_ID= /ORGANISM="Pseudokeronopsis sp., Strain Brazil" /LENGTH=50 /DNA_ID=CAMNT_0049683875 /DNA_START=499 /DNA_END=651 /DNA_ORIENTATION=-
MANILLHFPKEDFSSQNNLAKNNFLAKVDLAKTEFEVKISDFGLACHSHG